MAMTWLETIRMLGLDLLAVLLVVLVAGDCLEYVVQRIAPRGDASPR